MFTCQFTVKFDNGATEFTTLHDIKAFLAFLDKHVTDECEQFYGGSVFTKCYFDPGSSTGLVYGQTNDGDPYITFGLCEFAVHEDVAVVHFE